jgi:hypothetical protein
MKMSRPVLAAWITTWLAVGAVAGVASNGRKFYDDDPVLREVESQDASKVVKHSIVLTYDLVENLFARKNTVENVRARNVNTIDEVPDSSWFTNRILARSMTTEDALRGPVSGPGPAPGPMTVTKAKPSGVAAGFVVRDSAGETWYVQFDSAGHPEAATGAGIVANKIFYALGYWQVENHIAELRPEDLAVGEKAVTVTPSGKIRRLDRDDLAKLLKRAARKPNGAYRMIAGRSIDKGIGSFRYYGTRGDDPNDIVPHEHRRELRALKVFGAWTNLVDMKANNTLDALVNENGRTVVRHYLQDVGSTFGTGALGPREWDEGYEYLFESAPTWKRLISFGFYIRPWQTVDYTEFSQIGRFEGDSFDPATWKPRVPTVAMLNARADDNFWAARRVMAFSDDLIRAIVKAGQYSDPAAESHLADVLIKRRDRIGRAYLPAVNPIVDPVLDESGTLRFRNAAVDADVAPAPRDGYKTDWFSFDNGTGESVPLFSATASPNPGVTAKPGVLPTGEGSFVRIDVSAISPEHASWTVPVHIYFRRIAGAWKLVGLERLADGPLP